MPHGELTRLAAFLSAALSDGTEYPCVLSSLDDVSDVFFLPDGRYKCTIRKITEGGPRDNSRKLLDLVVTMVKSRAGMADAMLTCAHFAVPAYHVTLLLSPEDEKRFLTHAAHTRVSAVGSANSYKHFMSTIPRYLAWSTERTRAYRHHFHVLVLAAAATNMFTRNVMSDAGGGGTKRVDAAKALVERRVRRLLTEEIFSRPDKCYRAMGEGIVEMVSVMYGMLAGLSYGEEEIPPYRFVEVNNNGRQGLFWRNKVTGCRDPVHTLEWFLAGNWRITRQQPDAGLPAAVNKKTFDPPYICSAIDVPDLKTLIHVNVQVAHWVINAKERMGVKVHGRSLVRTVEKKKRVAASGYKNVSPDEVLHTSNSVNFNIHGHDLLLWITILNIERNTRVCSVDRTNHVKVSHIRSSTNSLQHGVMDTNHYRWELLDKFPDAFKKLERFPAVVAANMGLVHREAVLLDEKDDPRRSAAKLREYIHAVAAVDHELADKVYRVERGKAREILDNHVLGIVKINHFYGAPESVIDNLTFDRMLVAQNPKMSKSEFADKSRFDAESKGKASKKIKRVDKTKDRAGFLKRMNAKHKDLFVDPSNPNTRGKWGVLDRLHHAPDAVFYSKFTYLLLRRLRRKYHRYERFVEMVDDMMEEIKRSSASVRRAEEDDVKGRSRKKIASRTSSPSLSTD